MHQEAFEFVAAHATSRKVTVLECGSRNINGTVRDLFPNARWVGVDVVDGDGVDIVGDFAKYRHDKPVAVVVCCEVAEHLEDWPALIESAAANLKDGGMLIFTAAGPGRSPHSAADGGELRGGEWYGNIGPDALDTVLARHFTSHDIDLLGPDIRATAIK